MNGHAITMLGTGLIGDFYTNTLQGQRGRDEVRVVYSRSAERGAAFRDRWNIAESTTDLTAAVNGSALPHRSSSPTVMEVSRSACGERESSLGQPNQRSRPESGVSAAKRFTTEDSPSLAFAWLSREGRDDTGL